MQTSRQYVRLAYVENKMRDTLDYHEGALDVIDKKLANLERLKEGATETEIKNHK